MRRYLAILILLLLCLSSCNPGREAAPEQAPDSTARPSAPEQADKAAVPALPALVDSLPAAGGEEGLAVSRDAKVTDRRRQVRLFQPGELLGEWVSGTLHECYLPDGTGRAWDTGDDVRPDEAKHFTWRLDNNQLVDIYPIATGGFVPDISDIVSIDSICMVRRDNFGHDIRFERRPSD